MSTSKKISLSQVYIDEEIRNAILRVVDSGQYILGSECKAFEKELADYTGTQEAVLSSSWTAAVGLLLEAMGIKEGDEIMLPSLTAFPSVEPIIHVGATPVFIDLDEHFGIDANQLEKALTKKTVGILPVHLYGQPVNFEAIEAFAKKHGLWIIEDCAQSQGATYHGKRIGSLGYASAFSFYPSKNLTVLGDGGCICTNDSALAEKLRALRNHGRTGKHKYIHEWVGYNLRFNEMQAAAGRIGLRHLNELNKKRRAVAERYAQNLQGVVQTPQERANTEAVYHMYVVRCEKRDELAAHLNSKGIETGIHYPVACHQQPAITDMFSDLPKLPNTEKWVNDILSLPMHGQLSMEDVDYVCDTVCAFYGK